MASSSFSFSMVDQSIGTLNKVEEYVDAGIATVLDVAQDVLEHVDKDGREQKMKEVKNMMADYIRMQQKIKNMYEAIDFTKKEAEKCGRPEDLLPIYDKMYKQLDTASKKMSIESHENMVELNEKVQDILNPDEDNQRHAPGSPVLDAGMDIAMTQLQVNTKCPYTGMEMKEPVQNIICKHNYDREGILQCIKSRGQKAKCPVSGCFNSKAVETSDLVPNKELKRIIEKKNRNAGKVKKHTT